jgi:hypothetical protein
MKVAVYEVVEVTDEERVAIAVNIDGKTTPKRKASSAEMKQWLWEQGATWRSVLGSGDGEDAGEDLLGDGEDLLGTSDPDLEDLI